MRQIFFLLINENINSGIIQSQVIDPLRANMDLNIKIINIHKFYSKGVSPNYQSTIALPFAIPAKLFLFNFLFFLMPFIAFFYALILCFFVRKEDLLIARSYFSGVVALVLFYLKRSDFVFDTRSLFVDENVNAGRIKESGMIYKMWRYFERLMLEKASKVIVVSEKQVDFYHSICSCANIVIVPCFTERKNSSSELSRLNDLRKEEGYSDSDIIVGYFGSLDWGWNNINIYVRAFEDIIEKGGQVMIISQNHKELVRLDSLKRDGIHIVDTANKSLTELRNLLSACDYGIVMMKKSFDWETRLSIKFVEYLNCNLKVIVGRYVGEAVRYGKKYFSHRVVVFEDGIGNLSQKEDYSSDIDLINFLFGFQNFRKYVD